MISPTTTTKPSKNAIEITTNHLGYWKENWSVIVVVIIITLQAFLLEWRDTKKGFCINGHTKRVTTMDGWMDGCVSSFAVCVDKVGVRLHFTLIIKNHNTLKHGLD